MSKNSEPQSQSARVAETAQTAADVEKESVDAPPPILGRWTNVYLGVIVVTLGVYGLLYLFSAYAR